MENTNRYEAYGKQIPTTETTKDRLSFISRENDYESELGEFVVRKYNETGNNPVSLVD